MSNYCMSSTADCFNTFEQTVKLISLTEPGVHSLRKFVLFCFLNKLSIMIKSEPLHHWKLRDYADLHLPRLHKSQITRRCGSWIIADVDCDDTRSGNVHFFTSVTAYSPYFPPDPQAALQQHPTPASLCMLTYHTSHIKRLHHTNQT